MVKVGSAPSPSFSLPLSWAVSSALPFLHAAGESGSGYRPAKNRFVFIEMKEKGTSFQKRLSLRREEKSM
jgi:hypothetical protein